MKNNLVQLTEDLQALTDSEQFWARIKSELAQFGVTSVFYGALSSKREAQLHGITRALSWKSDHPKEWFETFGVDTFLDSDESAIEVLASLTPFDQFIFWHDMSIYDDAGAEQLERADIEWEMGFRAGFTAPTNHLFSGHLGGVGVSMGELSPHEFDRMWPEKQNEILAICGLLDMGMREQHLRSVVGLSARQEECLVWLAAGLMPAQIADQLTISQKTVEHHISLAKGKLNANTRDHAVAKALMLNLIKP